MLTRLGALTCVLVLGVSVASASAASIITIVSGDGETWTGGAPIGGGAGTTVVVDPHPAWQPAGLGAWVSYADTGYGGTVFAGYAGTTPIMTVTESFVAGAGSTLNLKVWADDTARVLINGVEVLGPNFTQGTCAAGPIGCEPHEFGSIVNYVFQTGGLQTISFEAFQTGTGTDTLSNPFGILYEGSVNAVPEPATLTLFGLLLTGIARRLRRKAPSVR